MPPDALVLAFDTSAAHCAAALLSGDRVLAERVEPMEKGQAERLMPMLEEMLADTGKAWRDLTCIGVGTGPGNFTGVRISVAAARGLALGLGIPAVGVSTLEAQAFGTNGMVICSLDARKGALYVQVFRPDGAAVVCDLASLPDIPGLTDDSNQRGISGLPLMTNPSISAAGATSICIGFASDQIAAHYACRVAEPAFGLTEAIARIALLRRNEAPRPAPFYLRGADAAPSSDPPPVILP